MNIAANSRRISGGNEMKEQSEIDDGLIHCKLYVYDMSICQPVISGNKPARQPICTSLYIQADSEFRHAREKP